jgi:hypothetical protein
LQPLIAGTGAKRDGAIAFCKWTYEIGRQRDRDATQP